MNRTKDENLQLNEEPAGSINNKVVKHQKEEKAMKRTRKFLAMAVSIILILIVLAGCGKNVEPTGSIGSAAAPTPTAAPTLEAAAPTEVEAVPTAEATPEATPTEAVVEDNPNVIEGVDFTSYNEERKPIDIAMQNMKFEVPRLVVTRRVRTLTSLQDEVMCMLKDGDKFVEEPIQEKPENYDSTYFVYHIYAPKQIKKVSYNEETIQVDSNGDGNTTADNHISSQVNDEFEWSGVQYSKSYSFWMAPLGMVTDDEVIITIEYEDGTSDQMTVYITKEYVEYGN